MTVRSSIVLAVCAWLSGAIIGTVGATAGWWARLAVLARSLRDRAVAFLERLRSAGGL